MAFGIGHDSVVKSRRFDIPRCILFRKIDLALLSNCLKENCDRYRSDRAVDELYDQEPRGIGCLNPHVPESRVDPDGGEEGGPVQKCNQDEMSDAGDGTPQQDGEYHWFLLGAISSPIRLFERPIVPEQLDDDQNAAHK